MPSAAASRGLWIRHRPAVEQVLAGVDGVGAADALDERGLAGAVVADQRGDLAGVGVEVDAPQDLDRAEALVDPAQLRIGVDAGPASTLKFSALSCWVTRSALGPAARRTRRAPTGRAAAAAVGPHGDRQADPASGAGVRSREPGIKVASPVRGRRYPLRAVGDAVGVAQGRDRLGALQTAAAVASPSVDRLGDVGLGDGVRRARRRGPCRWTGPVVAPGRSASGRPGFRGQLDGDVGLAGDRLVDASSTGRRR